MKNDTKHWAVVTFDNLIWEGPASEIKTRFRSPSYLYEGTDLRGCRSIEVRAEDGSSVPWRQFVEPLRRSSYAR